MSNESTRARRVRRGQLPIQPLEPRCLLAAVAWDGGGDGVSWGDANNWSNNQVPTAADDVTIDVPGNIVVTLGSTRFVRTLVNAETLRLLGSNLSGNSILSVGVSFTNAGTVQMDSTGSSWESRILVGNGATLINAGLLEVKSGAGGGRAVQLGTGGVGVRELRNDGAINVSSGAAFAVDGSATAADNLFTQNGTISVASDATFTLNLAGLNYIGGSHAGRFRVINSRLDLDAAASPSVLEAGGNNTLLGHDAGNLTLSVRGSNFAGSATLIVGSTLTTSGAIELTTVDSTWTSRVLVAEGVSFTSAGALLARVGAGGDRVIQLGSGGTLARTFRNDGTIGVEPSVNLNISGSGLLADNVFAQNGLINVSAGGLLSANTLRLNYVGGSNSDGFRLSSSQLQLDAAGSPSVVQALGANTLIAHDAANITLQVRGSNAGGSATLSIGSSLTTTGPIQLTSVDSTWQATVRVPDGLEYTNAGVISAVAGAGGNRVVQLGNGGSQVRQFRNNGAIDVATGVDLAVTGSGSQPDNRFTQNGTISIAPGGSLTANSLRLHYVGGSNQPGLRVTSSQIDLDAASAPSVIDARGANTLLGHDAANVTLVARGSNLTGNATLDINADLTTTGPIELTSIDSTWQARVFVVDGATYTNAGTLTASTGAGGPRVVQLGSGGVPARAFRNDGTITVQSGVDLGVSGSGVTPDNTFTQDGAINIAAGGFFTASNLTLNYIGGAHSAGFRATGSRLDLDAAASPSVIAAVGGNRLIGHDAANLTLAVRGANAFGNATLEIVGAVANNGLIVLDTINQAFDARINVNAGATFTNGVGGVIRIDPGAAGGTRTFNVVGAPTPGEFVNNGVIRFVGDGDVGGSGSIINNALIEKPDIGLSTFAPNLINGSLGTVRVDAGTLRFDGSTNIGAGGFLSTGRYLVAQGATLSFGSNPGQWPTTLTAEVELSGTGVAELGRLRFNRGRIALLDGADLTIAPDGGNPFTNEGIIDLSPTSILTVNANMAFGGVSQPVIRAEIASLAAFGRVQVNGALNLDSPDSTSRFDPDLVGGFDPALNSQFDVITATGGVTNGFDSFQGGLTPGGNVLSLIRPNVNTVAVKVVPGPLPPPPEVLSQVFEFETREAILFTFDQDVSAFLSRKDYQLQNLTLGTTIANNVGLLTYNLLSNQATLTFTNAVPDGNYRLTINASDIANSAGVSASGSPIVLDFFIFRGDANRDRLINIADFSTLAARFNLAGTYSQGDFNYDGVTTIADFSILAAKFNTSLPAARPAGAGPLFGAIRIDRAVDLLIAGD